MEDLLECLIAAISKHAKDSAEYAVLAQLLNSCISFSKTNFLVHAVMVSQRLKKIMIEKLGDQAGPIAFYFEVLNLLRED